MKLAVKNYKICKIVTKILKDIKQMRLAEGKLPSLPQIMCQNHDCSGHHNQKPCFDQTFHLTIQ